MDKKTREQKLIFLKNEFRIFAGIMIVCMAIGNAIVLTPITMGIGEVMIIYPFLIILILLRFSVSGLYIEPIRKESHI